MATAREPMLSPAELAVVLGVSTVTLYRWRRSGRGPKFTRAGGQIRYRRRDVDRWADKHSGGEQAA